MKILIVDDEPSICEMVCIMLEQEGHNVVSRHGALDLPRVVDIQRPDLVLLDVMMPGINGFQALAQLREECVGAMPRVVLMSAYIPQTSMHSRAIATVLGADAFLTKPFELDALLQIVNGADDAGR